MNKFNINFDFLNLKLFYFYLIKDEYIKLFYKWSTTKINII